MERYNYIKLTVISKFLMNKKENKLISLYQIGIHK